MELLCGVCAVEHARWRVIATEHHGYLLDASPLPRSGPRAAKGPSATSWIVHL